MDKNAWDEEVNIDRLIRECDDTFMPLPDIEFEPHLLISKVRKYYMGHMIKLLSLNYETNQRLVNKNIYLPSAIWKCAKKLEMKAAQTCMVVQLYRKCILSMINEVKLDTIKGRLYNKLYESLHHEPPNEKKTQTVVTGESCNCYDRKRRRKRSEAAITTQNLEQTNMLNPTPSFDQRVNEITLLLENNNKVDVTHKIPVLTNMQVNHAPEILNVNSNQQTIEPKLTCLPAMTPKTTERETDDLMMQLEKLFQGDQDEDDLFTNSFSDDKLMPDALLKQSNSMLNMPDSMLSILNSTHDSIIENHSAQIKSLDARLATLTGLLANNEPSPVTVQTQQKVVQKKQKHISKWQCEEYFLKKDLFEMLYHIKDVNRKKYARIKELYQHLFGEDNDDEEGIMSPIDTPDFVASCKARIDIWVMLVLAPYYAKGRIQGKVLYKSVARHLIDLIYKCKQYPSRYEVTSFVLDFLQNHGKIRCEADFKEFRINNVHVPTF